VETTKQFEIGPIRPPSEADSLLLRITRNCPWNKCKFCTIYKDQQFKARTVEDIKADIDQVAQYRENVADSKSEGLYKLPEEQLQRYLYIMQWMEAGEESVFLQDADTMVLTYDKLHEILSYLRKKLPNIKRVTTYARVNSLNKFTVEQLKELKEAGLDRIHAGYESGSDEVLKFINKGYSKAAEIEAGQKVKASGIELSIYYMPGVGGRDLSEKNAKETADVINRVNPDFVRIRTFVPKKGSELYNDVQSGQFAQCTDKEKALELKKLIEHIDGADGEMLSDHIINLFEDVKGNMNTDKEKMLSVFTEFENFSQNEQRRYQMARRLGLIRTFSHVPLLSNQQNKTISEYLGKLDTDAAYEDFLLMLLRRYI